MPLGANPRYGLANAMSIKTLISTKNSPIQNLSLPSVSFCLFPTLLCLVFVFFFFFAGSSFLLSSTGAGFTRNLFLFSVISGYFGNFKNLSHRIFPLFLSIDNQTNRGFPMIWSIGT